MQPLVSIYIPTRDRSSLVARAIDSVLNQDVTEVEILAVDDGSMDTHRENLCARYKDQENVRIICNQTSRGAGFARNLAIEQATGKFITGLDDDDWFEPDRLRGLIERWDRGMEDLSALFTAVRYRTARGERISRVPATIDFERLLMGNYIGNQVFTLTSRLQEIGGFDVGLPAMQDFETWLRLTGRFGPAVGLATPSYVVDMTHGDERISEKPVSILQEAYDLIYTKHDLTDKQAKKMKALLFSYRQVPMGLGDLLEQWSLGNYRQATSTYLAKLAGRQS